MNDSKISNLICTYTNYLKGKIFICITNYIFHAQILILFFNLFNSQNDHISFMKQSDRRTFSLAIINSCMSVRLSDSGSVENIRLCFGGMDRSVVLASKTGEKIKER